MIPSDDRGFELLPDALETLYDEGLSQCLDVYPELRRHKSVLRQMQWAEIELTDSEIRMEDAAALLRQLEAELKAELEAGTLHPYTLPRRYPVNLLWTWINWQWRRIRLRLNTRTRRLSPFTTSGCSWRSPGWAADAPTASWKRGSTSTTAASAERSTLSGQSTEPGAPG